MEYLAASLCVVENPMPDCPDQMVNRVECRAVSPEAQWSHLVVRR
jgi:hypothetical protein